MVFTTTTTSGEKKSNFEEPSSCCSFMEDKRKRKVTSNFTVFSISTIFLFLLHATWIAYRYAIGIWVGVCEVKIHRYSKPLYKWRRKVRSFCINKQWWPFYSAQHVWFEKMNDCCQKTGTLKLVFIMGYTYYELFTDGLALSSLFTNGEM